MTVPEDLSHDRRGTFPASRLRRVFISGVKDTGVCVFIPRLTPQINLRPASLGAGFSSTQVVILGYRFILPFGHLIIVSSSFTQFPVLSFGLHVLGCSIGLSWIVGFGPAYGKGINLHLSLTESKCILWIGHCSTWHHVRTFEGLIPTAG